MKSADIMLDFTRSKPLDAPWPRIPTQAELLKALQFATH